MKRSVLVTLADAGYINQAKQLFSSAHWNGGWDGDYLLLACEIPERSLGWFREKGVSVKKCELLHHEKIQRYHPVVLSKLYLFCEEMKQWENVVYLDADIIVRGPLGSLADVKGFGACRDFLWHTLRDNMVTHPGENRGALARAEDEYDLSGTAFNTGVMAFSTDIIKDRTFSDIKNIFEENKALCRNPDQLVFNLFFYRRWIMLPSVYNCFFYAVPYLKIWNVKAVILHFIIARRKPWNTGSPFYGEWEQNLGRAGPMNIRRPPAVARWDPAEVEKRSRTIDVIEKAACFMREALNRIADSLGLKRALYRRYPDGYWRL